jgi:hypothetical protein
MMAVHIECYCDCKSENIVIEVVKLKQDILMQLKCKDCNSIENLPYKVGF